MSEPTTEVLSLEHETRSSIELSRDAKGIYRYTVKLYFESGGHGYIDALEEIAAIDQRLRVAYLGEDKPTTDTRPEEIELPF